MERTDILKAMADETRMRILTLLLRRNYCVRALAAELEISPAAVSQHLKILREAGLVTGEKKGYFMHYHVNRETLLQLAEEIRALAEIRTETGPHGNGACGKTEAGRGCRCRHTGGRRIE